MQKFLTTVHPTPETTILDVGGLPRAWQAPISSRVTFLNLTPLDEYEASFMLPHHQYVVGDGRELPWEDQSFDLVFSNNVIEHVGTFENQQALAREARRVGRGYWIQTPAKEFPVEPHYWTLGLHWCSKRFQKRFLKNFSLWGLLGRPTPQILDQVLAELRLMTRREFKSLFPDSQLWVERVAGLAKSYNAYKLPAAVRPQLVSNPNLSCHN